LSEKLNRAQEELERLRKELEEYKEEVEVLGKRTNEGNMENFKSLMEEEKEKTNKATEQIVELEGEM